MEFTAPILPTFPDLKLDLFLNVTVLGVFFALFFVFYAVITSILMYHWYSYGMKSKGILFAETIFLFVSLVLFVGAGTSLFYF